MTDEQRSEAGRYRRNRQSSRNGGAFAVAFAFAVVFGVAVVLGVAFASTFAFASTLTPAPA